MKKIEKLTPEQTARFPEFVEKWTKIGLSTEPADRPRAEAGIVAAYAAAGLAAPKIIWCGSPLAQGLVWAILRQQNSVRDSVWASVRASVRDSVWASVRASVRDSVRASVRASVRDSVWDSVGDSVWTSVGDSVRDSVRDSVGDSVGDSVWASVRASVRDSVWDSVGASVGDSVRDSVGDSIWASVGDSVGDSIWASVRASVRDSVWDSGYGSHDANWVGFYDFFADACMLTEETSRLHGITEICKSAGWWLPTKDVCFVSERHNILNRDSLGRLHCENGPAVGYPDGWSVYAWHGVRVPEFVILRPEEITAEKIKAEQNSEIRRAMVGRIGQAKYLAEMQLSAVHSDPFGLLYSSPNLTTVRVLNSTPEPDGTLTGADALAIFEKPKWWRKGYEKKRFKEYFLDVHPELRPLLSDGELGEPQELTARNAVASTFGMRGDEYLPEVET